EPAELLPRAGDGRALVAVVAQGYLPDTGLAGTTGALEHLPELGIGLHRDHHVGMPTGETARVASRHRDAEIGSAFGDVPEPGRLHVEVPARVGNVLARPERADDLDRLLQHLVAGARERPHPADDVLVEVLARAETERETAVAEELHRRGLLGDDRRVVPPRRARDVGHQRDALG